jgi:hypothetical protein
VGTPEFRVNVYTTSVQRIASVASDANGRLVVMWESRYQDGDEFGIFGRRYDPSGTPGPEFQVNGETMGRQVRPKVAMTPTGSFVVVWHSREHDSSGGGIRAQRYNAAGVAQSFEFQVNSYTTLNQSYPSVATDAAGNFVVVWHDYTQDGSDYGIFAQRYNAAGVPQGGEFRVNSYTTGDQYKPVVAMDADGDFVVVWSSADQDDDQLGVFGQRYDASGVPQGDEFRVNTFTTARQFGPAVTMHANGSFVVVWHSPYQDGSDYGVFGRAFDDAGLPLGSEFQVNSFTTGNQFYPSLASSPGGRFVVTWVSYIQDGDNFGTFARQFATDLIFEDGFE